MWDTDRARQGWCAPLLQSVDVGLAGADAHRLLDRRNEDFSVTDLARAGGGGQLVHDLIELFARDRDLEPQFRKKVYGVFGAAVDLGVALLPPIAFDLRHGHAVDAYASESVAYLFELEWLDDGNDEFHGFLSWQTRRRSLHMIPARPVGVVRGPCVRKTRSGWGRHGLFA